MILGPEHSDVATGLNSLASLYKTRIGSNGSVKIITNIATISKSSEMAAESMAEIVILSQDMVPSPLG